MSEPATFQPIGLSPGAHVIQLRCTQHTWVQVTATTHSTASGTAASTTTYWVCAQCGQRKDAP